MRKYLLIFLLLALAHLHVKGSPMPQEEDDEEYADGYDENGRIDERLEQDEDTEDPGPEDKEEEETDDQDSRTEDDDDESVSSRTQSGEVTHDDVASDREDGTESDLEDDQESHTQDDEENDRQDAEEQDDTDKRGGHAGAEDDEDSVGGLGQDNRDGQVTDSDAEGREVEGGGARGGKRGKGAHGKKGRGKSTDAEGGGSAGSSYSGEESAAHTYQQVMQILNGIQINANEPLKSRLINGLQDLKTQTINMVVHIEKFSRIEHCFGNLDYIVQLYAGDAVERNDYCKGACIDVVSNDFRTQMNELSGRLSPCLQGGYY